VGIAGLRGFPPIAGSNATSLILGSMPGSASLTAHEYYAHPRNAFWSIAETVLGIPRAAPYDERTRALANAGIAVWDVLKACRRNGSLDSAIETDSIVVNDFRRFLAKHSGITHIFFNGGTACALFQRHVLPLLSERQQMIPGSTLPSTSPANARLSLAAKIQAWRVIRPKG
jgi:TDG/mug DNA glycosylase family protein